MPGDEDIMTTARNDSVAVNASAAGDIHDPAPPEIPPDALNLQRSTFLARRLRLALLDLCARVPEAWVTATPKGIDFERLTIRQCDRLVRSLKRRCPGPRAEQSGSAFCFG